MGGCSVINAYVFISDGQMDAADFFEPGLMERHPATVRGTTKP